MEEPKNDVNLNNIDDFHTFINNLKIKDQVHFKTSDSNPNIENETFMFFYINRNDIGEFAIFANPVINRSIVFDINNPVKNEYNIISILIGANEENLLYNGITDENKEEFNEYIEELNEWNREYNDDEILNSLVSELPNSLLKEYSDNPNKILREAYNILDFIKVNQKVIDGLAIRDAMHYTNEHKPLKNDLVNLNFNRNIYPIVADIKKYYTKDESLLDNQNDDIVYNNNGDKIIEFINEEDEYKFIKEVKDRTYSSKSNPKTVSFNEYLKYLYEGGSIELENNEGENILNSFNSINRPYLSNANTVNSTKFITKIPYNTTVYRTSSKNDKYKTNFDNSNPINTEISYSSRLADGPLMTSVDKYEEALYTDNKGKYGKISSCVGTKDNDIYMAGKKDGFFFHQILRPPKPTPIVDSEELVIVGIYLSGKDLNPTFKNSEIVYDDGDTKLYPKIKSNGLDITDIYLYKENNVKRNVINIYNINDFNWREINDDTDYMIFFDKYTNKKIDKETFISYIEKLTPDLDNIIEKESNKIKQCENFTDINNILNKYNIEIRDINKELMNKLMIKTNLIKNIDNNIKYEKYLHNNYLLAKSNALQYRIIFTELLNLKRTSDNLVLDSNSLPNEIKSDTIKNHFINSVNLLFKQYSTEILFSFSKKLLLIKLGNNDSRELIINKIIDKIIEISPINFNNTEFYKFLVKKMNLIHPDFEDIFEEFLELYNIEFREIKNNNFIDYDILKLKQIDFFRQLNNLQSVGKELFELMDLSIYKTNQGNIDELIEKYARQEYESNTNKSWNDLDLKERHKWYPNEDMIERIEDTLQNIKEKYEEERRAMKKNVNSCGNLPIVKVYTNLAELEADNGKDPIYRNKLYDTLDSDINEYKKYSSKYSKPESESEIKDFINHLGTLHPFLSEEQLKLKYDDIIRFNGKNNQCKDFVVDDKKRPNCRPVDKGDIALLIDNGKRFLYKRVQNVWVILDKSTAASIQRCYNYDEQFLNIPFSELEDKCLSLNSGIDGCINVNNDMVPKRLFNIIHYQKFLNKRKDNIEKILEFKGNKDSYITKKIKLLKITINNIKNIKNKNKRLIENKKNKIKTINVYPPRDILDELILINRIEDLPLKCSKIKTFIDKYGIPYNRNSINGDDDTPEKSSKYYYDFDKVNIPIICKHYTKLFDADLGTDFENKLNEITQEWGILEQNQSRYTCKNCGEELEMNRLSEFSGIGIFLREKVDKEIYNEDEVDLDNINFTQNEDKIKKTLDSIIRVIGIKLTNKDYVDIIRKVADMLIAKPALDFNDYYYKIKSNPPEILNKFFQSSEYQKQENMFLNEFGSFDEKIVSRNMLNNQNYVSLTRIFHKLIGIYKIYVELYKLQYLTNFLILTIITAIPDYYIKGTGSERKNKSKLFGDPFTNQESIKELIYETVRNDIEFNNANDEYKGIRQYFNYIYQSNLKKSFADEMEIIYNDMQNTYYFQKRYLDKTELRNKSDLIDNSKYINKYKWDEFLPLLPFVSKKTFELENTTELINYIKKIKNSDLLNKLIYQQSRLSYSLFTLMNHKLVTEENIRNIPINSSDYSINYLHSHILENYNDYFNSTPMINGIRKQLQEIYDFWKINKLNKSNTSYLSFITPSNSNHLSKVEEINRDTLENKLKLLIYTLIPNEGPLQGKKRIFKEIKDKDYYLLTDILNINPDINKDELRELLTIKIKEIYPEISEDFLNLRLKLIIENNGIAEIDIISGDFRNDLTNKYNKIINETHNIKSLEKLINEMEIIANKSKISKLNDSGVLSRKNNISNSVKIVIESFKNLFMGSENIYDKVIKIQNKYQFTDKINTNEDNIFEDYEINQFNKEVNLIITKNYDGTLKQMRFNISSKLKNYKKMNENQINNLLENIGNLKSYWDEINNSEQLNLELKIEGFNKINIRNSEFKFRNKLYDQLYNTNSIQFQINLIQLLLTYLQRINNRVITKLNVLDNYKNPDEQFKPNSIYYDLVQNMNLLIDKLINNNMDFYIPTKIQEIQNFLDSFISYELQINPEGVYNNLFINSPELFKYFIEYILIYLLNVFADYDELKSVLFYVFDVLNFIYNTYNITDKKIETIKKRIEFEENRRRTAKYDRMSDESKQLYKVYRNLGLGNIFGEGQNDDDLKDKSEELMSEVNTNIVSVKDIMHHSKEFDDGDGQDNEDEYD